MTAKFSLNFNIIFILASKGNTRESKSNNVIMQSSAEFYVPNSILKEEHITARWPQEVWWVLKLKKLGQVI